MARYRYGPAPIENRSSFGAPHGLAVTSWLYQGELASLIQQSPGTSLAVRVADAGIGLAAHDAGDGERAGWRGAVAFSMIGVETVPAQAYGQRLVDDLPSALDPLVGGQQTGGRAPRARRDDHELRSVAIGKVEPIRNVRRTGAKRHSREDRGQHAGQEWTAPMRPFGFTQQVGTSSPPAGHRSGQEPSASWTARLMAPTVSSGKACTRRMPCCEPSSTVAGRTLGRAGGELLDVAGEDVVAGGDDREDRPLVAAGLGDHVDATQEDRWGDGHDAVDGR